MLTFRSIISATAAAVALGSVALAPVAVNAATRTTGIHRTTRLAATEKHPHLQNAKRALNRAIAQLKLADHDSAGHREKSLDHAQQALAEVELAIALDR